MKNSLLALLFLIISSNFNHEAIRAELAALNKETGLRLVAFRDAKFFTIAFDGPKVAESSALVLKGTASTGTVSPDGSVAAISYCREPGIIWVTQYSSRCPNGFVLATVGSNGSGLHELDGFTNPSLVMCWSRDMSKLVLQVADPSQGTRGAPALRILDLKTESAQIISTDQDSFVDAQCWSPDQRRIAFTVNREGGRRAVEIYDIQTKGVEEIKNAGGNAGFASWSPDGKLLSFLHCPASFRGCKYYGLSLDTKVEKPLFDAAFANIALSWSPDSRFVAYVSAASPAELSALNKESVELMRLRVRRLEDGAEEIADDFYGGDMMWFGWAAQPNLP